MNREIQNSIAPDVNIVAISECIDNEAVESARRYIEMSAMEAHPLVMVFHEETKNMKT
jgi:hypothetical protein